MAGHHQYRLHGFLIETDDQKIFRFTHEATGEQSEFLGTLPEAIAECRKRKNGGVEQPALKSQEETPPGCC